MGFRFRRSIRLFPGVRVNLSRSGPSISVGGHGLTANVSSKGTKTTFSLPGTGLSYQTWRGRRQKLMESSSFEGQTGGIPQESLRQYVINLDKKLGIALLGIFGFFGFIILISYLTGNVTPSNALATASNSSFVAGITPNEPILAEAKAASLLPSTTTHDPNNLTEVTTRTSANVRSGPGMSFGIRRVAHSGETFTVLSKSHGWVQVEEGSIPTGWIADSLLR